MQAYLDGLKALMRKKTFPASFNAADWQAVAPAIRQRSFFSSTIESAKVLSRFRRMLLDWQAASTEDVVNPAGIPSRAYKITGLADFRLRARELLVQEGLATPADFKDDNIKNIASNARLKLIFNTNTQQADEFAAYEMRVTDPDYINRFPAARFVRRPGAIEPRLRHVEAQGQVRRWDDFAFWLRQNAVDIGGFSVPWGPWGFNSYMTQQPVGRKEAEALGLVRKNERVMPLNLTQWGVAPKTRFNQGVEANVDDVTPEIRKQAIDTITARLGPGALSPDGKLTLETFRRLRAVEANPTPLPMPAALPILTKPKPKPKAPQKLKPSVSSTTPAGSKVSSKIQFGQIIGADQDSIRAKWENVQKTIDEVHGDGPLPTTLVRHTASRGTTNGEFWRSSSNIYTYTEDRIPLTLTHEIGHWIDFRGFRGIPGAQPTKFSSPGFASHEPMFKKFIKLAKETKKMQAIKSDGWLEGGFRRYLQRKHEIFARAYSQYIAIKSRNPEILADLRTRQGNPVGGKAYPVQWDDDDFLPLYEEIETIFKQIGWLKT
jgi:hypothetical protein